MPSSSKKQKQFMAACTNPKARKVLISCPPLKVAKELHDADKQLVKDVDANPTPAQIEAGNYRKGHIKFAGLDITIENPRGSVRSGIDPGGKAWSVAMNNHYGYIKRTLGADGDHVDVFLGGNPDSQTVYIIDQIDGAGKFDEHKCMVGFDSKADATKAYLSNYSKGWKLGPVTAMPLDKFKSWLKGDGTQKPATALPMFKAVVVQTIGAMPHPRPDHDGNTVMIDRPSIESPSEYWKDAEKIATFVPDGDFPLEVGGRTFSEWVPEFTAEGWNNCAGIDSDLVESPIEGEVKRRALVVVKEPDGRVWLFTPTNNYGGYVATFPGGTVKPGYSCQATAISECFEKTGLLVEITGLLGDFSRPGCVDRVYSAVRIAGTPTDMGWESQAAHLVPVWFIDHLLNMPIDRVVAGSAGPIAN